MNIEKYTYIVDNWINGNITDAVNGINALTKRDLIGFIIMLQDTEILDNTEKRRLLTKALARN